MALGACACASPGAFSGSQVSRVIGLGHQEPRRSSIMDTKTIDLFGYANVMPSVEERVETAKKALTALFEKSAPCVVAYSGGKDSSTVLSLALNAAAEFVATGRKALVVITSSDTRVENPEVAGHIREEIAKAREFAQKHGIGFHAAIVQPSLAASMQVKWLIGRGLPSYAGQSSDCSLDTKVYPQRRYRTKLFKQLAGKGWAEPVTCLGTRFEESERRALSMKLRGERADVPVRNKDGDLVLSPIAMWSTEDVFEYMGMVSSGVWPAYTDFKETLRIYAHSAGTSCSVVADAIYEGGAKKKKGGCGARHGCFVCQQSEDKSLEAMVEFDERYAYARGLIRLNKFIRAIRYDWSRRHWVGRTIKAGYIAVEPDTLHPKSIRELTRYMMQLDHDEQQRAMQAGEAPKFEILPPDMLVALDAMQSLNGVAKPFQVWADRRDIYERGIRYDIPEIEPVKKTEMPAARFLYVGRDWDDSASWLELPGLRNAVFEAMTEGSPCAPELKTLNNGRTAWKVPTEAEFSVDMESFWEMEQFEMDRILKKYDRGFINGGITEAYTYYLTIGVLKLTPGQQSQHDEVARRTQFKDRLGLTLDYDIDELLSRTVSFAELPEDARKAWAGKATTDSSQTDFLAELDEGLDLEPMLLAA